jgi:DNA invertase Pin-like site-specific DNA recombinase
LAQPIGELETHRAALVASSQGIDTSESNPAGRLQMQVLAAAAEFERSVMVERINAGLAAAPSAAQSWAGREPSIDTLAQLRSCVAGVCLDVRLRQS